MSPMQEVLEKALDLDEHDRAEIVETLLESIEAGDPEEEFALRVCAIQILDPGISSES